jgi:hypothetical protein
VEGHLVAEGVRFLKRQKKKEADMSAFLKRWPY